MQVNPELHYLNHIQNTSFSKQTHTFSRASRFQHHNKTQTDFKYNPRVPEKSRSCTFGFGNRVNFQKSSFAPGPNNYNTSKFPISKRSTTLGFGFQKVKFGTVRAEVQAKNKIPSPGMYNFGSSLKAQNFTLKERLPDDIEISMKKTTPGPGRYEAVSINPKGRYVCSKFKNTRAIFVDGLRGGQSTHLNTQISPATYDVVNKDSKFSDEKIERMRRLKVKCFGTAKRRGPEERHRLFVPPPGFYQTFSSFDCSYINDSKRVHTEY